MPRILLIEDEDSIRHLISYDLKNAGFDVTGCPDGASAREKGLNESFDIMIIDWMLPEISGIELVRLFRGKGIDSVMMMLTAKDEEEDILEAFEAGVDDYITKPFSPRELLARIQAHVKRIVKTSRRVLEMGGLTMDLGSREVSINGQPVSLTKKEFELLEYLLRNPQIVLSRDNILNEIWDFDYDGDTRIVDVHIFKLRNKLQGSGVKIASLRGVGYKLEVQA
ncbi:response regulator transcription factor [Holdemania filiformis]|mgnify:FL=1|uniref:DNA-binding response regulator n=1 Tax=Holdemania filiformis TaxID=61171 RepID=A0A412G6Z2_9FIRM|nr:response regulator transcription factor [Holdemania filiformis]MBS5000321.1 response regulator transcription factor [Holdemania filiformis]RGR76922.1 DNA-binding response regulator [Holdemania filiformis]